MLNDLSLVVLFSGLVLSKGPELPPCPTNVQYFPQNLPMHCRMPRNVNYPAFPENMLSNTMPPFPAQPPLSPAFAPPYFPSGKEGGPLPVPVPPGIPGPMPIPMPMAMVPPGPAHKLPVIVMPFYSPDHSYQKPPIRRPSKRIIEIHTRRPFYSDTSSDTDADNESASDTSSDTSSDGRGWWKGKGWRRSGRRLNKRHRPRRKKHARKDLLTPILQYVTKDGYVIFEKKITKDEAKDWLSVKKTAANKVKKDRENEAESNDYEEADKEHKRKNSKEGAELTTHRSVTKKRSHRKVNILKTKMSRQKIN
ncbi:WW domain-binding protein 11-like [Galleria mellonella]|uniref:WW domain-binding protein 11-like n=1 Tax=Galleria mellonella TaxID=7137 RepID=A0ABM3MDS6_GALME|nr:WW domain-binding protein 11-like [Galleria mellonella]XP_052749545.1 WW domain-binding protein 11-like [Galleria mellonella]XP_052749547.1 WW domain-binding protein 11-like [Galleria mellonella]